MCALKPLIDAAIENSQETLYPYVLRYFGFELLHFIMSATYYMAHEMIVSGIKHRFTVDYGYNTNSMSGNLYSITEKGTCSVELLVITLAVLYKFIY